MLAWLQDQWSQGISPRRDALMGSFVVDRLDVWHWEHERREEQFRAGVHGWEIDMIAIRKDPSRPVPTPTPIAEAYRRALRTLVDRGLVLVTVDAERHYTYSNPEAESPGEVVGRRRATETSKSETRRQIVLAALPADGAWIDWDDLLMAFWFGVGGSKFEQYPALDRHREARQTPVTPRYVRQTITHDWLKLAMKQLRKAGRVATKTEQDLKGWPCSKPQRLAQACLIVVSS
jgi:hypothetical protein